ncbi:MAG: tRNA pseudouridine(38-40) synthase TruA [Clostridia bacterium]|nr:tRNA pseudouridine(38-40) synthase TruA [Clostridia bacterium]
MQGYVLTLAFKGAGFCGWQVQPGKRTVQEVLQDACEAVFGVRPDITGCSRTDSGVHAKGFVALASFKDERPGIPADSLPLALNAALPGDIAVLKAETAPEGFHPRYSAKSKEYIYTVRNSRLRDPFTDEYAWLFPRRLDEKALEAICAAFAGKKDFRSFMASGSKIKDTVRTVYGFSVKREGDMLYFRAHADGFLYNMVRIMVGTAAEACANGLGPADIEKIIAARDRSEAGITAPAKGLCLNRVFYD